MSKTHFRKAFSSPYLGAADITEPTILTISRVRLEEDKTKKTKTLFNTAYFAEPFIREGEKMKPMILNATNSKMLSRITGSAFIDDWNNVRVLMTVNPDVKFGKESVEGLRIKPFVEPQKPTIPENHFENALLQVGRGKIQKAYLKEKYALTADQIKQLDAVEVVEVQHA